MSCQINFNSLNVKMKPNKCFPVILQEWVMFSCRHARLRLSPPAGESLPHQWGKVLSVLTASLSTNTTAVYLWASQWPIQSALSPPHSFLLPPTLQCTGRTDSVLKRNLLSNSSHSDLIKQTGVIINVEIFTFYISGGAQEPSVLCFVA